jgi:hypothetical protein
MLLKFVTYTGLMAVASCPLLADFSYQQKSTITGGAMAGMMKVAGVFSKQAREPMEDTIAVQGNKMVHRNAHTVSVVDLDKETITTIDMQRKSYSVMTFEQMKQMMQQMSEKMRQKDPNGAQMSFKVSAKSTGNTKEIAGNTAKELVLKMEMESTDQKSGQKGSMLITTDMWMATPANGYAEMRAFERKMAEKINWSPGGNMFMQRPDMAEGMAQVSKEIAKLDGMPILEVVTMGMAGQPGAEGSQGTAQSQPAAQPQQEQPQEKPSIGGALGGALGGRFGLGRKKQKDASSSQQSDSSQSGSQAASGGNSAPGSLLEMTVELSGFSAAPVDSSMFEVPAGFKQVEPDSRRMH